VPKRNFGLILVAVECIQKRIWETSTDKLSRSDIAHDLGAMTLGLLACRPEWAGRVCVCVARTKTPISGVKVTMLHRA